MTNIVVRELTVAAEHQALAALLGEHWANAFGGPAQSSDILTALAHSGNYVAAAFAPDGTMLGGGYAFRSRNERLHSHAVEIGRAHD